MPLWLSPDSDKFLLTVFLQSEEYIIHSSGRLSPIISLSISPVFPLFVLETNWTTFCRHYASLPWYSCCQFYSIFHLLLAVLFFLILNVSGPLFLFTFPFKFYYLEILRTLLYRLCGVRLQFFSIPTFLDACISCFHLILNKL